VLGHPDLTRVPSELGLRVNPCSRSLRLCVVRTLGEKERGTVRGVASARIGHYERDVLDVAKRSP